MWVMVNHVHFLVDMITNHIKKGLILTSAETAEIPREALAPRAPAVVDTATSSNEDGCSMMRQPGGGAGPLSGWQPDRNQRPDHKAGGRQSPRLGEGQGP